MLNIFIIWVLHPVFLRAENQEKFYLYIIVSVTAGILIFLGLVIGRLLVSRHRAKRDAKFHANNEALPNGFTDDISEIDADIDRSHHSCASSHAGHQVRNSFNKLLIQLCSDYYLMPLLIEFLIIFVLLILFLSILYVSRLTYNQWF